MKRVDYLIVGAGLAGIQFALQCQLNGATYHILDDPSTLKSSYKAAGIINPVTGRNYVKSWNIDQLLPHVHSVYKEWEQLLNEKFLYPLEIRRVLRSIGEENRWNERLLDDEYQSFLDPTWRSTCMDHPLHGDENVVRQSLAFRLDMPKLLQAAIEYFKKHEVWEDHSFSWEKFDLNSQQYNNVAFERVVFCRGAYELGQPFEFLPIRPNLGEVFFIELSEKDAFSYAIKKGLFIVPIGNRKYWVGGSYRNVEHPDTAIPKYDLMEDALNRVLAIPYTILEKTFGIRPTVPDRKPLIGVHPKYNHIALLNGLGTKGASLSPYCSIELFNHLNRNKSLNPEIDLKRYL